MPGTRIPVVPGILAETQLAIYDGFTSISTSITIGMFAPMASGIITFPAVVASAVADRRDLVPTWIGSEPIGIVNYPATPPGAPTGPAGGSLAGTYPNPTLAGRDTSVDKINQDLLPALLVGDATGVVSYPPAATGVASSDNRDMIPEWIGHEQVGITTIGGQAGTITQITVDMGTVPTYSKTFIIADSTAQTGMRLLAERSNDPTADHSADESEMDSLWCSARVKSAGVIELTVRADPSTGPVIGTYNVNYFVPTMALFQGVVDNRDMVPEWIGGESIGLTGYPATPPGAPTGPAGGSLSGTYPNPTFSGRDSSVDKINQDLLPSLLGGDPLGVTRYDPASANDVRKDLIPSLFVPEALGIVTYENPHSGEARKDLIPSLYAPDPLGVTRYDPASANDVRKDLIPSLYSPDATGIVSYPPAATGVASADNRDMIPEWVGGEMIGLTTFPATPPGAPTGPAGGSLAGTYPNPTFAGRDTSVDALNKDLLPALLVGDATGVVTYPAATPVAGTSDNRDMVPEWIGHELVGLTTFPTPVASAVADNRDMIPEWIGGEAIGITNVGGTFGSVTTVTVNMGTLPRYEKTFLIPDTSARVGMHIITERANDATADHAADESEMDPLWASARVSSNGMIELTVHADRSNGPVIGTYAFNYLIPTQPPVQTSTDFNQVFMLAVG
jgi:hypothetical protein